MLLQSNKLSQKRRFFVTLAVFMPARYSLFIFLSFFTVFELLRLHFVKWVSWTFRRQIRYDRRRMRATKYVCTILGLKQYAEGSSALNCLSPASPWTVYPQLLDESKNRNPCLHIYGSFVSLLLWWNRQDRLAKQRTAFQRMKPTSYVNLTFPIAVIWK